MCARVYVCAHVCVYTSGSMLYGLEVFSPFMCACSGVYVSCATNVCVRVGGCLWRAPVVLLNAKTSYEEIKLPLASLSRTSQAYLRSLYVNKRLLRLQLYRIKIYIYKYIYTNKYMGNNR